MNMLLHNRLQTNQPTNRQSDQLHELLEWLFATNNGKYEDLYISLVYEAWGCKAFQMEFAVLVNLQKLRKSDIFSFNTCF